MDLSCSARSIGQTNPKRQRAGAAVLAVGALACAATTIGGWPLFRTLALLGAVVTLAWLADGTSQRYLGPGLFALAVGGGITIYNAAGMERGIGEHGVVYPLIGVALLLASLFNPMSMRGSGVFMLIVGAVVTVSTPWNPGWTLVAILASWSALEFVRINRGDRTGEEADVAVHGAAGASPTDGARTPVGASGRG